MRIVFMGTSDFAVPSLNALFAHPAYEVVAAVTQPDRPKGRGNQMAVSPVKAAAISQETDIFQPLRIKRKDSLVQLASYNADIFVVASYGQILSEAILDMPRYGCICVHASLLPRHRGASPIQQAVLSGDKTAGVTIMQMDKGIDTGDILATRAIPVLPADTGGTLHDKLAALGAEALIDILPKIEAGTVTRMKQNDADATYAPILTKDMGHIDWRMPAVQIVNQIRGLNPWPSAYFEYNGQIIRVHSAEASAAPPSALPGTVCVSSAKAGLIIAAADGSVRIGELQAPNGKRMKAEDYLRGHNISVDTVLL